MKAFAQKLIFTTDEKAKAHHGGAEKKQGWQDLCLSFQSTLIRGEIQPLRSSFYFWIFWISVISADPW